MAATLNLEKIDLPITEVITEVQSKLSEANTLIVNAPPGAGKSTILPLALMNEPWLNGKKILLLEPRRLAARGVATRMSELIDSRIGEEVGFRIRFETAIGPNTKIEVVTEGILTRMLQTDSELEDVGLVIFDEFHERSIHADLALALCREAQQVLRPDLRILIMSATLDMPTLEDLLKCESVISQGRQYPVDVHYCGELEETMIAEQAATVIQKAARKHNGDILAFFPGQREILNCEAILKSKLTGFRIHPLYGALPFGKQRAAILPDKTGKRKVVLATSIAETSLTIEGVKVVVDTGFGRRLKFDPRSGLSRLKTVTIDKDSADQRAGRAGRLEAGVCYRLWSKASHSRLQEHRTPEISEADLTSLVLNMLQWGIINIEQLTWLTPPPNGAVEGAKELLRELGALKDGKITDHGVALNHLPCHPRLGHMLLKAAEWGIADLACDLAAILEERDPLPKQSGIDVNLRIEALREYRSSGNGRKQLSRIEKIASSYRKLIDIRESNEPFDPYETGLLLAQAYPERIASARPGNNAQFQLSSGKLAMAGHKDDLAYEPWLAVAHVDARDKMGKIFLAAPLNPTDLAPMVEKVESVIWDTKSGGLSATQDMKIGNIILQSTPLPDPDPERLTEAICRAVEKEGEQLLNFSEDVIQLQNRILSLKKWNPSGGWPDVTTPTLLATNSQWLQPYLSSIKKPEALRKLNLTEIITNTLDWDQQQKLNKLAPRRIEIPSGSSIKLKYRANGEPPVLAARIQELFGLDKSPTINEGKQPVLIHLLSPGYKPVQTTTDLENFWNETYFEVRKELKGRYPKHDWPDDPRTAVPKRK